MILSHKHKFIFICNGKTGTTSIEKGLARYDESQDMNRGAPGLWDGKHMPAAVAKGLLPSDVWDESFKFAFVRNPYDWCVSQHKHNFRSRLRLWKLLRHPMLAAEMLRRHFAYRRQRDKRILDESDVEILFSHLKRYRGLPIVDGLYQNSYVNNADGKCIVDFIGKFESLQEDVRKVQNRIGIHFDLPHLNATNHPHYSKFLSPSAIAAVGRLWQADFEAFGYDREAADGR